MIGIRSVRNKIMLLLFVVFISVPATSLATEELPVLLDLGHVTPLPSGDLDVELTLNIPPGFSGTPITPSLVSIEIDQVRQTVTEVVLDKTILPIEIALAIDTSGSMRKRLDIAKEATAGFLAQFPDSTQYALYSFNDEPIRDYAFGPDLNAVRSALAALTYGGKFTSLYDTIARILDDFPLTPSAQQMIILITDGKDENSRITFERCLERVTEKRIPIFTIAMGTRVEEAPLREFAAVSDGLHYSHSDGYIHTLIDFLDGLVSQKLPTRQQYRLRITPSGDIVEADEHTMTITLTVGTNRLQQTKSFRIRRTSAAEAVETQPSMPGPAGSVRMGTWQIAAIGAILFAVLLVIYFAVLKKKKTDRICPKCGEEIPDYLEECIHCSDTIHYEDQHDEADENEVPARQLTDTDPSLQISEERLENTLILEDAPYIVQMSGNEVVQSLNLAFITVVTAGRKQSCDLVITDRSVSSLHAQLIKSGDDYFIEDLGSTNGTFLNDRRIEREKVKLGFGDKIRMGQTRFVFRLDQKKPL